MVNFVVRDINVIFTHLGLIDRGKAEALLETKPVGTFLVRITTKLWGYTVSVKGRNESFY